MDKLTFLSELINNTVWPFLILITIFLFRNELKLFFPRIKRAKIGNAEIEFEKTIEVLAENSSKTKQQIELTKREKAIISADLNGSIIKTWLEIEYVARKLFAKFNIAYTGTPHTPFLKCIKELEDKQIISFDDSIMIRELQILRNRVVHDRDFKPSKESVEEYVVLTKTLIEKLKTILSEKVNKT